MAEESFVLVSLKEPKSKKLAQVISNETSRKILEHLSKKTATETELSQALKVPISTIHYNLQHLVENKLIVSEEFHYSQKGKEVLHYKLANKLIIIAPAEADKTFLDKLRSILPVGAFILAATAAVAYFHKYLSISVAGEAGTGGMEGAAPMLMKTAVVAEDAQLAMAASAPEPVSAAITPSFFALDNIAIWFFVGAIFSITIYLVVEHFRRK